MPYRPWNDRHHPPVRIPDPQAGMNRSSLGIADLPARQPLRRQLHLVRCGVLRVFSRSDVDRDELGPRVAGLGEIGAGFIGLVIEHAASHPRTRLGCRQSLRPWSNAASRSRPGESDRCPVDCRCSHCPGNLPGLASRSELNAIQRPSGDQLGRKLQVIFKLVRYFLTGRLPKVTSILLVESGSRGLLEGLITGLRQIMGRPDTDRPGDLLRHAADGFRGAQYARLPRGRLSRARGAAAGCIANSPATATR